MIPALFGRRSSELSDSTELAPLADRLAMLLVVRLFMAMAVLTASLLFSELPLHETAHYAAFLYVALAVTSELSHRIVTKFTRFRWLWMVNSMLIVDGLFVAVVLAGSGQSRSVFIFLAYVHIVSVTLLVGFRTGLKMALWHSILLLSVYYLGLAGAISVLGIVGQSTDEKVSNQLEVAQASALWIVAIVTAAFAGVNERELRRRKGELTIIADLASDVEKTRRPSEILALVNRAAVSKLKAVRSVAIVVHNGQATVVSDDAAAAQNFECEGFSRLGPAIARAAETAAPAFVRAFDPLDAVLVEALPNAANIAVVPLVAEGEALGVLAVDKRSLF